MAQSTRGSGSTTFKTAKAKKLGKMALFMRAFISKDTSMVRDAISGQMVACTKANGSTIRFTGSENMCGLTDENTTAPGWKIKCTARGNLCGLMVASTKATLSMISKKGKALSSGPMAKSTQASG